MVKTIGWNIHLLKLTYARKNSLLKYTLSNVFLLHVRRLFSEWSDSVNRIGQTAREEYPEKSQNLFYALPPPTSLPSYSYASPSPIDEINYSTAAYHNRNFLTGA